MHSLLTKLLQKRKIDDFDQLDAEEKATFKQWDQVLSKEKLDVEDIRAYCNSQISVIEGIWRDLKVEQAKKSELIPYHTVYKLISQVIDSPQATRNALEIQLNQLINQ